jgi:hypothetical protein
MALAANKYPPTIMLTARGTVDGPIVTFAVSADLNYLAIQRNARTISIYTADCLQEVHEMCMPHDIGQLVFSDDESYLAVTAIDRPMITIVSTTREWQQWPFPIALELVAWQIFCPSSHTIAVTDTRVYYQFDLADWSHASEMAPPITTTIEFTASPDLRPSIVVASPDTGFVATLYETMVLVYSYHRNPAEPKCIMGLRGVDLVGVTLADNGNLMVITDRYGYVGVYSLATLTMLSTFTCPTRMQARVAVHPRSSGVAVFDRDHRLFLWNIQTKEWTTTLLPIAAETAMIHVMQFSRVVNILVLATQRQLVLVDVPNTAVLATEMVPNLLDGCHIVRNQVYTVVDAAIQCSTLALEDILAVEAERQRTMLTIAHQLAMQQAAVVDQLRQRQRRGRAAPSLSWQQQFLEFRRFLRDEPESPHPAAITAFNVAEFLANDDDDDEL